MEEKEKTKEQLLNELTKLRQQIAELQESEIKHQQIEDTLRENEEKYRILVEGITDGIHIETVEGRILECNTAVSKMFGYTKEEMIGLTIADLVPKGFAKKLPEVITEKETTHGVFVPRISKKKDGTIFPTEIATQLVNIRGKPRLVVYIRDITKRKKAEKRLKKARNMFASLFNSSPEALVYEDLDGTILNINPRFTELFGYTLKEIKGRNIDEGMIHPPDKIEEGKKLTRRLEYSNYETIRKKKDGTLFPVLISLSPVIVEEKHLGAIALYQDITERKKAEEALLKSQQKFVSLFKSSPEALVYLDKKGNIIDINPRFTELFGYSLEEIKGRNIDDGMIHPPNKIEEGKDLVKMALSKGYLNYETIRKKKDGTLFPVSISGSNIVIDGELKGTLGSYIDITERKEAEMAIIYEQSLLHALMDNIPDFIYFKDEKNRFVRVNKASGEDRGITPEDFIGKTDFDIFTEKAAKKCFADDDRVMKTGKPLINRIEKITYLNGMERWFSATKVPRYDEKGKIIGLIGISRDITEHVRNERLQQVLYNISKAANSPISLHQLYPLIHQELGSIIDTTNFYIALIDEKEDKVFFPYHIDEKDDNFPILHFSDSNSLTVSVIKTGQPLLVNYEQINQKMAQGILTPVGSLTKESIWLGVPLKVEDRVIGAMSVQSYTNPHLYSEKDIGLLEFVSSQVATAIERKKAEETLKKSQQEFASLFMNSPEALAYVDEKGTVLNINPRFTELFGYTLEEIKGKNINEGFIHPSDKIKEGKNLDQIASSKGYFHYETIRKKKDGTLFPVSISGSNVKINGQVKGLIGAYKDITERKRLEKKLERLAHFDALTGCYARGYGLSLFERQMKSAQRHKTFILLLYVDLNGLKYINDTFGHKEGDKVLKEAAEFFKSTLREVDIICRMGGDEFLLIFPDSSLNDVPLIKERITNKLKELNENLNKPYKISFSIGLSYYNPSNPLSIEELIKIADKNMYEEKKKKKRDD